MIFFENIFNKQSRCDKIVGASNNFGDADDILKRDIESGNLAQYVFYVPDQCNDGHSANAPGVDTTEFSGSWLMQNFFSPGGYIDLINDLPERTVSQHFTCCIR